MHLILLSVAVIMPFLVLYGLNLDRQIDDGRRNLHRNVQQMADTISANIEREMRENIAFLTMLSHDSTIDRGEYAVLYERAKESLKDRPGDVTLIAPDMKPIFHTRFSYGDDLPVLAANGMRETAKTSAQPAISDVYAGQITKRLLVAAAVPVMRQGKVVALMQFSVEPAELVKTAAPAGLQPRWTYAVADRKASYVLASDAKRGQTGQAMQPAIADQLKTEYGELEADAAGGEALVTAYRRSQMLGWTAFASVPASLAEESSINGWRNFIGGTLISLALGTLASLFFSRAMAQPIQHLTSTALAFSEGGSSALPPLRSRVLETQNLGAALKDAATKFRRCTESLERSETRLRLQADQLQELESLYDRAPIGLALVDTDLRILRLNECLAGLSGEAGEAAAGRYFFAAFPDLEAEAKPLCEEVLSTGTSVRNKELETAPRGGSADCLLAQFYPMRREDGSVSGIGIILEKITERRRAELTMAQLAAIVEAANQAIFSFAPNGRIQNWNPAAEQLFQYGREEAVSKPFAALFPEGSKADYLQLFNARENEDARRLETVMERKDNSRFPVSVTVAPIRNGSKPSAVAVTIEDITERRQWENRRRLMNRELSHRVKNALAVVQAMAHHTLRSAPTPAAFAAAFEGRLRAMSISHNLLTLSEWEGADMRELLTAQLASHQVNGARVDLAGPALLLPPATATSLGLIVHEMATNAEKYGALSAPEGVVTIEWRVTASAPRRLVLEWTETGGPEITQPERQGFGSVLIASTARVEKSYNAHGLQCTIEVQLPEEPAVTD